MRPDKVLKRRLLKRRKRVRAKLIIKDGIFRLCLFRGNKNLYAQIIDDSMSVTKVSASTNEKDFSGKTNRANIESAKKLGQIIAKRAADKNIYKVVFDRGPWRFHGKIKAFAVSARETGLKF